MVRRVVKLQPEGLWFWVDIKAFKEVFAQDKYAEARSVIARRSAIPGKYDVAAVQQMSFGVVKLDGDAQVTEKQMIACTEAQRIAGSKVPKYIPPTYQTKATEAFYEAVHGYVKLK